MIIIKILLVKTVTWQQLLKQLIPVKNEYSQYLGLYVDVQHDTIQLYKLCFQKMDPLYFQII